MLAERKCNRGNPTYGLGNPRLDIDRSGPWIGHAKPNPLFHRPDSTRAALGRHAGTGNCNAPILSRDVHDVRRGRTPSGINGPLGSRDGD